MKIDYKKLVLGFTQGAEFEAACRRNDFSLANLKQLTTGNNLGWVRNFLLGMSRISPLEGVVVDPSLDTNSKSASEIVLGTKQGGELQDACRREEFSLAMLSRLAEGDNLSFVKNVLLRLDGVFPAEKRIFDLDTPPADRQEGDRSTWEFSLNGMLVNTHVPGGMFEWHPDRVELWQSKKQFSEGGATLESIMPELAKKRPLNASLAFHLKRPENKHLIPPDWKFNEDGKARDILFLNTTLCDDLSSGVSFFAFLCWHVDQARECGIDRTDWMTPKTDAALHCKYGSHWYFACQKW